MKGCIIVNKTTNILVYGAWTSFVTSKSQKNITIIFFVESHISRHANITPFGATVRFVGFQLLIFIILSLIFSQ